MRPDASGCQRPSMRRSTDTLREKLRSLALTASAVTGMPNAGVSMIVFFVGMALSAAAGPEGPASGGGIGPLLVKAGIVLFCGAVAFSIVTLPVEWDASARAKRELVRHGLLSPSEEKGAAAVLNTAFMTYVAAAVSSISTLLYFLVRSGLLGGRRSR